MKKTNDYNLEELNTIFDNTVAETTDYIKKNGLVNGFELNSLIMGDCMEIMPLMAPKSVAMTLTDIPYNEVSRSSNGLRNLDKGKADILTFELKDFLEEVYRVTSSTIVIFCGQTQVSEIISFFNDKKKKDGGTVRQLIWEKTNPSPMNGQHSYLSGIENAVYFKKPKGTFNAFCKNTVFRHQHGKKNPVNITEKNHQLLKELINDNTNAGDIVFDPCAGSGSTLYCARELDRY